MAKFLSKEWFAAVAELFETAGELNVPAEMAAIKVNVTVEDVCLAVNGGVIEEGPIANPDIEMVMPAHYLYDLIVRGDWTVGMKGYMKREIKVSGNMRKLLPLQAYKPSLELESLRQKIEELTELDG